jgi:methyl-accepting chemotaxis protein
MDQTTQQNAAMVEESTAASRGLAGEAAELRRLVSQFDVGVAAARAAERRPAAPAATRRTAAPRYASGAATAAKLETVADEDGWEEF